MSFGGSWKKALVSEDKLLNIIQKESLVVNCNLCNYQRIFVNYLLLDTVFLRLSDNVIELLDIKRVAERANGMFQPSPQWLLVREVSQVFFISHHSIYKSQTVQGYCMRGDTF